MIVDGTITNNPVFNRGYEPMLGIGATQDEVFYALGKYVPAVSSPVGGNAVWNTPGKSVNMNLDSDNGGVPRPNNWGRPPQKGAQPWLHSDMKDMAFFYVYKLYEQIIQKGNLK